MITRRRRQLNCTMPRSTTMHSSSSQWRASGYILALCWLLCSVQCFQIHMAYRPPVKSSVSKFHDRRGRGDSRSLGSGGSSKKAAHAATYSSPATSGVSSFERRMRNLVLGAPQRKLAPSPQRTKRQSLPQNVHVIENLADYKAIVGDERHKLVVVRFYATWCRACKAVAPIYYRMAANHPDTVFVDVPVTDKNSALHQGLGVPSLPFGHIYHPQSGLVEEHKLTRKHVRSFEKKLDSYLVGSCNLDDQEFFVEQHDHE